MHKSSMLNKMLNELLIIDESTANKLELNILKHLNDHEVNEKKISDEKMEKDLSDFIHGELKNSDLKYKIDDHSLKDLSNKISKIYLKNSKNNEFLEKQFSIILYFTSIISMLFDALIKNYFIPSNLLNNDSINYSSLLLIFVFVYFVNNCILKFCPGFSNKYFKTYAEFPASSLFVITVLSYFLLAMKPITQIKILVPFFMILMPILEVKYRKRKGLSI